MCEDLGSLFLSYFIITLSRVGVDLSLDHKRFWALNEMTDVVC